MPRLVGRTGSALLASIVAGILAGSVGVSPSFGADPAQLTVTGKPHALNNAYGGLAVDTGVLGRCPDGGFVCTVTGSITGRGNLASSTLLYYIPPGISLPVTITLAKRGQKLLTKLGKLKIAITVFMTGPDGQVVTAANGGTVRLPKSLRPHH